MEDIIFQIDGRDLLGIVLVLAFLFVPIGISLFPYKGDPAKPPFERLQRRMGLGNVNSGLLFVAIALWTIILGSLVLGLLWEVWSIIASTASQDIAEIWNWRFSLAKIAALTATLGAVVALPFTLIRLTFARTQTETAVEALFNDKINAAVEDLHARRQISEPVTEGEKPGFETLWEDDVIRRNGAIDRLEGLAGEEPKAAPRIARMLSVYVRELSREHPAKTVPSDDPEVLRDWARALTPARSDMQNAVQVLGRLKMTTGLPLDSGEIDLTGANMQGFDLTGLDFGSVRMERAQLQGANLRGSKLQRAILDAAKLQGAILSRAQLQGADLDGAQLQRAILGGAQLQGAFLLEAQLQGAFLLEAQLQGAKLSGAQLQRAFLGGAQLQGADLSRAQFDGKTYFSAATLRGAALKNVNFRHIGIEPDQITEMFGDASVTLPDGHGPDHENWPKRWSKEKLGLNDFETKWRAFQARIGQDPDNPT